MKLKDCLAGRKKSLTARIKPLPFSTLDEEGLFLSFLFSLLSIWLSLDSSWKVQDGTAEVLQLIFILFPDLQRFTHLNCVNVVEKNVSTATNWFLILIDQVQLHRVLLQLDEYGVHLHIFATIIC